MEEEVVVAREGDVMLFDFHWRVFNKLAPRFLRALRPISLRRRGERVVIELGREEGEELRAWLLINTGKGFYITELESLEYS